MTRPIRAYFTHGRLREEGTVELKLIAGGSEDCQGGGICPTGWDTGGPIRIQGFKVADHPHDVPAGEGVVDLPREVAREVGRYLLESGEL